MSNKQNPRDAAFVQATPAYRLRRTSLLILGLGAGAFASATSAAPCLFVDTTACSAPGGTQTSERGGYGGAGNGQGGGSSASVPPGSQANVPGVPSVLGQGGNGAAGDQAGGGGGAPGLTTITFGGTATGGAGGPGQPNVTNFASGGGGGGDGLASLQTAIIITDPSTVLTGGRGGDGGSLGAGSTGAVAGGGGGGGAGISVSAQSAQLGTQGQIIGGAGGAGGAALPTDGYAGGGGGGGDGILVLGPGSVVVNHGTITGGRGGAAGVGGLAQFPAMPGASGAGVNLSGDRQLLVNDGGTIGGGASAGVNGAAGAAVVVHGVGNTVDVRAGTLQGGLQADGVSRGPAIALGSDSNAVIVTAGSTLIGDLVSDGTNNSLSLQRNGSLGNAIVGFSNITTDNWTLSGNQVLTRDLTLFGNTVVSGVISGPGALTVRSATDAITLRGANIFSGGLTVTNGTLLAVAGDGTLGTGVVTLGATSVLDISQSTAAGGVVVSALQDVAAGGAIVRLGDRILTLGAPNSHFTLAGRIIDGGITGATGGKVVIGPSADATFTGLNSYSGGTEIYGSLKLSGNGRLNPNAPVEIRPGAELDISGISGSGTEIGDLYGAGDSVNLGGKSLTLNNTLDHVYDGPIAGAGGSLILRGTSRFILGGNSTYTGGTSLQSGTLIVGGDAQGTASIAGNVQTSGGATLGGYGTIGGDVDVVSGAHFVPGNIAGTGTLTVGGNLTLDQGSVWDFKLGAPGTTPTTFGVGTHVDVGGDLFLGNGVLNVIDAGGFGPGLYNLFNFGGAVGEGGNIQWGSLPPNKQFFLLFEMVQKQVNLMVQNLATLNFWNANHLANATQMGGGSGTWSATSRTWTDSTGSMTAAMQPQPGFAIFGGAPGTVTVDNSAGAVQATGMQFASSGYTLTGGTLTLVDPTRAPAEIRVGDGSAASAGWTTTIGNVIAGIDGISKTGAGTLVLTGANAYTGGTFIRGGALSVSSDGNLGDTAGAITLDAGTLRVTGTTFNHTARALTLGGNGGGLDIADAGNTFVLDQALSGSGGLAKQGAGTLVLTADNTYTGTTTVSGGTLQLGNGGTSGSVAGSIVNDGTLVFKRSDDITFSNTISGSGNVVQAGPGSLTLSGDSSAYTGTSNVAASTLTVNGKLGGTLSIAGGAILAGTGTVGSTTLAGGSTLAPGNGGSSIGTLTVNGNLSFAPGAAYQVQADPTGTTSDLVHVTGTADLAGSVIHVGPDGNFAPSRTYTILTADGGVNGAFDSVSTGFAFLTPTLGYDPNDAFLTLKRNKVTFASLAQTDNQRAVAGALDGMAASAALPTAVSTVAAGQAPATFDALSGEIHPSTTSILQHVSQFVAGMQLGHLRDSLEAGSTSGSMTAQLGAGDASALPRSIAQPVWAQVFGNWRTLGATDDTAKVRESDGGLFVGADRPVGAGWRLGGAFGYTGSHTSLHDRDSNSDVDSYTASIYGGKAFQAGPGKINVMLGTAYTWHDIHTERDVGVAGLDQTLKAHYTANTGQVFGELGYALPLNDAFTLEPFAGAAWSDLHTRGFSESGGSAALDGESTRNDVTTTTLGLRAQTTFAMHDTQGKLHGAVGWRHAFGDVVPETTMAFDGSQAFTVAGAPIARDAAVLELGADVAVSKHTTVGVAYTGQFGSGNQQNAGSVNVKWRF